MQHTDNLLLVRDHDKSRRGLSLNFALHYFRSPHVQLGIILMWGITAKGGPGSLPDLISSPFPFVFNNAPLD